MCVFYITKKRTNCVYFETLKKTMGKLQNSLLVINRHSETIKNIIIIIIKH